MKTSRFRGKWMCGGVGILMLATLQAQAVIGILENTLPGANPEVGRQLAEQLAAAGRQVQLITPELLLEPEPWPQGRWELLILTEAGHLPAACGPVLNRDLQAGGRLLALGAPLFQERYVRHAGHWLSHTAYRQALKELPEGWCVADFEQPAATAALTRLSDQPESAMELIWHTTGPNDATGALQVQLSALNNWELLRQGSIAAASLTAEQTWLTCLWAKGSTTTSQLQVEWTEQDQSRWVATLALTEQWQAYVLTPEDFRYFDGNPERKQTRLRMEQVTAFSCGLSVGWGAPTGPHEYWLGRIELKSDPYRATGLSWEVDLPPWDGLFPAYKVYDCSAVAEVAGAAGQTLWPAGETVAWQGPVKAFHPRPQATGYGKLRPWRWIPLLEARSAEGDWRGAPAALILNPDSQAIWATCTLADAATWLQPEWQARLVGLVERMLTEAFFREAGATQYTYLPGQPVRLGAQVLSWGAQVMEPHTVEFSITPQDHTEPVWRQALPLEMNTPGSIAVTTTPQDWTPEAGQVYQLTVRLLRQDRELDVLSHELALWTPPAEPRYITVEKGNFMLAGKPWIVHGINYMPSSGMAMEEGELFEKWLSAPSYDAAVIERDLARVAGLGFNAVSVFVYHRDLHSWNLLDLLRRCQVHGLKVNLSLRPGTPMEFLWPELGEIITTYRLPENDTLFAYDLAWEPTHGSFHARQQYARRWTDYVEARYGTLAAAGEAWELAPEVVDGTLTVPTDAQVFHDGSWDRMVADYRLFLDGLLTEHYGRARDLVRELDPQHLVSFRMNNAGDPLYHWPPGGLPYDFEGLAEAVDFMGPEAYGRLGDWARVRPGVFTVAYARAAAPDLPVLWTEAGMNSWDLEAGGVTTELARRKAQFYADFYRMLLLSHSNGVVWWWYPGGFRPWENSDFGILNPDGTDRLVTRIIREYGPQLLTQGPVPAPTTWLEVDRLGQATGIVGAYARVQEQFWELIGNQEHVGLRLRPATE